MRAEGVSPACKIARRGHVPGARPAGALQTARCLPAKTVATDSAGTAGTVCITAKTTWAFTSMFCVPSESACIFRPSFLQKPSRHQARVGTNPSPTNPSADKAPYRPPKTIKSTRARAATRNTSRQPHPQPPESRGAPPSDPDSSLTSISLTAPSPMLTCPSRFQSIGASPPLAPLAPSKSHVHYRLHSRRPPPRSALYWNAAERRPVRKVPHNRISRGACRTPRQAERGRARPDPRNLIWVMPTKGACV